MLYFGPLFTFSEGSTYSSRGSIQGDQWYYSPGSLSYHGDLRLVHAPQPAVVGTSACLVLGSGKKAR